MVYYMLAAIKYYKGSIEEALKYIKTTKQLYGSVSVFISLFFLKHKIGK